MIRNKIFWPMGCVWTFYPFGKLMDSEHAFLTVITSAADEKTAAKNKKPSRLPQAHRR